MSYYRVCSLCGAALDPGERCDCREKTEIEQKTNKGKAASVLEHRDGRVEQVLTDAVSASSLSKNEEDCKHEF